MILYQIGFLCFLSFLLGVFFTKGIECFAKGFRKCVKIQFFTKVK